MMKKTIRRKRYLLVVVALFCTLVPQVWAYDFSAVAPSGQTLYYEIDGSNVTVVPQISSFPYYNTSPTGALTIPSSVTYNGTTYSVTSIGSGAFCDCSRLTSVTIPNSVTSIGSYAFYYCSGLTSVICKGATPPTLGNNGISTIPTITVPCGTTSAYRASWGSSRTYQEAFLFELNVASSNDTMGTAAVQQQPSCSDSVAILIATPATGYRFDHWSDGSTYNPYTLPVTSDTTLVAYFAIVGGGTDGISNIKNNNISVYTTEGRICVTIDGQTTNEFSVYDVMGRRAAHVIASDKSPVLPAGVYIVKVGTLSARKVVVVR